MKTYKNIYFNIKPATADSLFRAVLREGLVLYAKPPLTPLPAKSLGLNL